MQKRYFSNQSYLIRNFSLYFVPKKINKFANASSIFSYLQCKELVATLNVTCKFCRLRFCYSHGMPEIHGCGDAAKSAARQQISRDGKLYSGSGRPSMLPDPTRKAQLQRRLDKKLNDMTDQRKTKSKPSK